MAFLSILHSLSNLLLLLIYELLYLLMLYGELLNQFVDGLSFLYVPYLVKISLFYSFLVILFCFEDILNV